MTIAASASALVQRRGHRLVPVGPGTARSLAPASVAVARLLWAIVLSVGVFSNGEPDLTRPQTGLWTGRVAITRALLPKASNAQERKRLKEALLGLTGMVWRLAIKANGSYILKVRTSPVGRDLSQSGSWKGLQGTIILYPSPRSDSGKGGLRKAPPVKLRPEGGRLSMRTPWPAVRVVFGRIRLQRRSNGKSKAHLP